MSHEEKGSKMNAIEALLNQAPTRPVPLPAPADRKRLREAYGLTQAQVAETCGVKPGTVSAWESPRNLSPRGEIRETYAEILRRIAERLGESTDWEGTDDDQH